MSLISSWPNILVNISSKQMTSLSVGPSSSPLFGKKVGAKPERPSIIQPSPPTRPPFVTPI
ncbi:hypothetical protein N7455_006580 [Penicillium solitum]|uniref:uncharacterized protein n=1 Tax=Penicillium solitum TaxID=60172 RepID=UPI0032C419A3|nr:hypothetical protein N7455_006580 [Penicillium solitum]